MPRVNFNQLTDFQLDSLIPKYAITKAKFDDLKREIDTMNKNIKSAMKIAEVEEFQAGEYVAKKTVSTRESINEEMLVEVMRKHNITSVIRTKEYVDMDELENVLYNLNEIPPELLSDLNRCRNTKEVITLKVIKKKGE